MVVNNVFSHARQKIGILGGLHVTHTHTHARELLFMVVQMFVCVINDSHATVLPWRSEGSFEYQSFPLTLFQMRSHVHMSRYLGWMLQWILCSALQLSIGRLGFYRSVLLSLTLCAVYVSELKSSCLDGKWFSHWVITRARSIFRMPKQDRTAASFTEARKERTTYSF